jgi:Spy/CpxP family protein refolding chaperone
MKKLFFLTLIFGAIISTTVHAQNGSQPQATPDPAVMLQQMKDKQVPGLVEKAGLTTEQANKLVEINFEMRMAASALGNNLSEADRSAKIAELKAAKEKKIAALLTPEQIESVKAYYEEMRKNMPKKD